MTEAKFTKGPYFVQPVKSVHGMFTVTLGENGFNEDEDYLQVSLTESDSNAEHVAHLFAAAPEMYEMLDEVSHVLGHNLSENHKVYIELIKELLAKARGENV